MNVAPLEGIGGSVGRKLDTRHFLIDAKKGRIVFDMGYMSDDEIKLLLREFTIEHERRVKKKIGPIKEFPLHQLKCAAPYQTREQ